jgi:hypothetical protein
MFLLYLHDVHLLDCHLVPDHPSFILTVCSSQILDLKTTGSDGSLSTVLVLPNAFRSLKVRQLRAEESYEYVL